MKIAMSAAILAVCAPTASAQTACFPGDHMCQHQQWHNETHNNAIEWMNRQNEQQYNQDMLRNLQAESEARDNERAERQERQLRDLQDQIRNLQNN